MPNTAMLYKGKKGILCHLLSGFSGFSYSSERIMISFAKSGLYKAHSGRRMVLAGRSRGCSSGTVCKWILSWTAKNSYTDCCPIWKAKKCSPLLCLSLLSCSQCLPSAATSFQHWQELLWEQEKNELCSHH